MNIILQYRSNASSISLGRFDQYMLPVLSGVAEPVAGIAFLQNAAGDRCGSSATILSCCAHQQRRFACRLSDGLYRAARRPGETGRSAVNVLSFLAAGCLPERPSTQAEPWRASSRTHRPPVSCTKTAETIASGTGIPKFFNDEVVVRHFSNRGVSLGCAGLCPWLKRVELSIPGRTYGLRNDIAMFQPAEGHGDRDAGERR